LREWGGGRGGGGEKAVSPFYRNFYIYSVFGRENTRRPCLFLLQLKCFIIAKAAKPYSVSGYRVQFTSVKY
jgi:hypothetical protein